MRISILPPRTDSIATGTTARLLTSCSIADLKSVTFECLFAIETRPRQLWLQSSTTPRIWALSSMSFSSDTKIQKESWDSLRKQVSNQHATCETTSESRQSNSPTRCPERIRKLWTLAEAPKGSTRHSKQAISLSFGLHKETTALL